MGAVVVGFDRHINYYKIQYAQLCINENKGCQFIATNLDAVTHLTDAQEWAGNGSMAGAIKGCTGRDPTVVGKPAPLMIDYICAKYNLKPDRICMVPLSSVPHPPPLPPRSPQGPSLWRTHRRHRAALRLSRLGSCDRAGRRCSWSW